MANNDLLAALQGAREVNLTVKGRRSGREITIPVWFVQEDGSVYLLPIHGSESAWYRNVLHDPTVRLAAEGADVTAQATPVDDAARVAEVVDTFRSKYGAADVENSYPRKDAAVEVSLD